MLLEHGYNDLGIQALLVATDTPKGSFYHHFKDKESFALQVIEQYMRHVHAGLDVCPVRSGALRHRSELSPFLDVAPFPCARSSNTCARHGNR
jgi:AcrR family transcriptional regulator